ncbi:hypothetical protein J007_06819 [Cryptococcus neoformans]|nr:hypothetical protein J007_06819 [Cryptococcus neoformans var. grubii]OXC57656.1 hypothetical protein C358_06913 [Cryptococcus neoformans var. grubii MW-RSA852]
MVWRTMLITVSTSFLLGTTFTHWIADHNVLWRSPVTTEAISHSIKYYSLLASAPNGLGWVYIAVGLVLLLSAGSRSIKGYRGSSGEVLFDGGSLGKFPLPRESRSYLVLVASITYYQLSEVYPAIAMIPSHLPPNLVDHPLYPALTTAVRDLATSNIMTALMLTGLILLQAGRYYAKRPTFPPDTTDESSVSTPASASAPSSPETHPIPVSQRSATPFRELTEDEVLELNAS